MSGVSKILLKNKPRKSAPRVGTHTNNRAPSLAIFAIPARGPLMAASLRLSSPNAKRAGALLPQEPHMTKRPELGRLCQRLHWLDAFRTINWREVERELSALTFI